MVLSLGVDVARGMLANSSDGSVGDEFVDGTTRERQVDLAAIRDGGGGDELHGSDILDGGLVGSLSFIEHGTLNLFLDLSLGPFLLLGLGTLGARLSGSLSFGGGFSFGSGLFVLLHHFLFILLKLLTLKKKL